MFDDELHEGRRGCKRSLEGKQMFITSASLQARQKAWLSRGQPGSRPGAWRPKKLYRTASRRWIQNVDNQIRRGTQMKGLSRFRRKVGSPQWANWRHWPSLSLSLDLGSDGVTATSALTYKEDMALNLLRWPDPSHGCNRSVDQALVKTQLRGFWMLMMISWNLPFGPDADSLRQQQMRETMSFVLREFSPAECPLYQELGPRILKDLTLSGVELPGEGDPMDELWAWMKERNWCAPAGQRCNLNRFMSSVTAARDNVCSWHLDLFERLTLCLELDFVRGQQFLEKIVHLRPGKQESSGESAPTASNALTIEARSLRGCAANAVAISALMLSDANNRRIVHGIVGLTIKVREWHVQQNRQLRDATACCAWTAAQAHLDFMQHVVDIVDSLQEQRMLEAAGFLDFDYAAEVTNGDVIDDDFMAALLWKFCWNLVGARLRRGLYLFGWPTQLVVMLRDDDAGAEAVRMFEKDLQIFRALEGGRRGNLAEQWYKRHEMRKVATQQFSLAFAELGFSPHPPVKDLIRRRVSGILSTQICEDAIGAGKNAKTVIGNRRYRRPEASMAAILKNHVPDVIHRYQTPKATMPIGSKAMRVPDEAFRAKREHASMDFASVVGTKQSADWWCGGPQGTAMILPLPKHTFRWGVSFLTWRPPPPEPQASVVPSTMLRARLFSAECAGAGPGAFPSAAAPACFGRAETQHVPSCRRTY